MAGKVSTVSVGAVNERRLRPIYEHLDNCNHKSALHEAEKVLRKQKNLTAAKVLKTIALHRLGREDEAYSLSQEVALVGPTDENSLQGLSLYYREIYRPDLVPPLYEIAVSKCPGNEEYLTHLFMSYVRTERPKEMQRVAITLFRHHPKNPYLFWGIMSIVMQANENKELGRTMFLPLAERMIEKHIEKGKMEAEAETRLYLMILDMLGKHEKALKVLEGQNSKQLTMDREGIYAIKTEFYKKMEKWDKVNSESKKLYKHDPDIWNHVVGYLDSLKRLIEINWKPEESEDAGTSSEGADYSWELAVELFLDIKKKKLDAVSNHCQRGSLLAVFELRKRLKQSAEEDPSILSSLEKLGSPVDLATEYFEIFDTKPCCFRDTEPYIKTFSNEEKTQVLQKITAKLLHFLATESEDAEDDRIEEKKMWKHLFYTKMQKFLGYHESLQRKEKLRMVEDLLQRHSKGFKFSEYRPQTDIRVADEYCSLAANMLIDLYKDEGNAEDLWRAVYVLELGKQRSLANPKFKFTLIRLYCEVGIFLPCAQIYDSLDIKHIQHDTLGYIISHSVASLGHYQLASQAYEASSAFFFSNKKDSVELLISCFRNGTFHKVSEFISFRNHVRDSLNSAATITEHTYMDFITHADIDVPHRDLLESCCLPEEMFDVERLTDNRDFSLQLDWPPENRQLTDSHIRASFNMEKKWLRFREVQVRATIALLKRVDMPETSEEQTNHVDLNFLLEEMEKVIEEMKRDADLHVKFPFHGPPEPRAKLALETGYLDLTLKLFRISEKILNEIANPGTEKDLKEISTSIVAGIEGALLSTGLISADIKTESMDQGKEKRKSAKHDCGDHDDDNVSCVTSSPEETTVCALILPVPNVLKELKRETLERLVVTCELFSLCVFAMFQINSKLKSETVKRKRKKKGKQEPVPSVVQFYQEFIADLKRVGLKVKSAVIELRSRAEDMTLDLSKTSMKPKEKLSNGDVHYMQKIGEDGDTPTKTPPLPDTSPISTNTKNTPTIDPVKPTEATPTSEDTPNNATPTSEVTPNNATPLPDQIVKIASESLLNSTKQILDVVEGRLGNLKAIKV